MSSLRPKGFFPTPGSPRSQRAWPRRWGTICSMSSRTSGSTASVVRSYLEMAAMVPSLAKILPQQGLRVYAFFALQCRLFATTHSALTWFGTLRLQELFELLCTFLNLHVANVWPLLPHSRHDFCLLGGMS